MNKSYKYALNGSLIFALGNALFNLINQLDEIQKNQLLKFNWRKLFIAAGKGAAVGGTGGFILGTIVDYKNAKEKRINTDAQLHKIASNKKLDKTDQNYIYLSKKVESLTEVLKIKFAGKLKKDPIRFGSTESGVALKDKFDMDVCLPFRSNAFSSTKKMNNAVYNFLKQKEGTNSIVNVRNQKKSIGLSLPINGTVHKVDIVPLKISKGKRDSGYLYKNDNYILMKNSSYTKTNINSLKSIRLTKIQQDIIVILKNWKLKNDIPLSSHLLQNLVLDAYKYNQGRIPKNITKKVVMVFNHIAENLDVAVIRGVENSNNIITNIPQENKNIIINSCRIAIEDYKYQPNSIIKTVS
jgi:hypothetical protein